VSRVIILISSERYGYIYDKVVIIIGSERIDPPAGIIGCGALLPTAIHLNKEVVPQWATNNWKAPHFNSVISGHKSSFSVVALDEFGR
jgi:hypothetical protein